MVRKETNLVAEQNVTVSFGCLHNGQQLLFHGRIVPLCTGEFATVEGEWLPFLRDDSSELEVTDVSEAFNEHVVWRLLMRMSDSPERSRLLIDCLELWDAVTCVKHLLEYLYAMSDDDIMRPLVEEKLTLMQVYKDVRMLNCCYKFICWYNIS